METMKKVSDEPFVEMWMKAVSGGNNMSWVAEQLGITLQAVMSRAESMRADGIKLPGLKRHRRRKIGKLNKLIGEGLAE